MANLLSIAELVWSQLNPNGRATTKISKDDFLASAKTEFAYQMWVKSKNEKNEEGVFEVPSYLLTQVKKEVVNDEMDISDLKILRALDFDTWLQNVGGVSCTCRYVKTNINLYQALCDDDSLSDSDRLVLPIGKKLKFPKGVHQSPLEITYANMGENVDDRTIEIDDTMAGIIRRSLLELYAGKSGETDQTNNSNPNN